MDATDAAALRSLGAQEEWWVGELPPLLDADALRCLDALGLVEGHHPLWQPSPQASHGWASPILMPSKWGEWPKLLAERMQPGSTMAARIRLTGLGRAALAKLNRAGGEPVGPVTRDGLRIRAEEATDLMRRYPSAFVEAIAWYVAYSPTGRDAVIGFDASTPEPREFTLAKTLGAFRTLVDRYAGRSAGSTTHDMTPDMAYRIVVAFGLAFDPAPIPQGLGLLDLPWTIPNHARFPLAGRSGAALAGGYHDDRPWIEHPWSVVREAIRLAKRHAPAALGLPPVVPDAPEVKSTVKINGGQTLDRVRDALFDACRKAHGLASEMERLEAMHAKAKSPNAGYFYVPSADETGRELDSAWSDKVPVAELTSRRTAIDAALSLRAAVDVAIKSVAGATEWMDSPAESVDRRWTQRTIGSLRKVRGAIVRGHEKDVFPSVLPMIRAGVHEALRTEAKSVCARMEEVKSANLAGVGRPGTQPTTQSTTPSDPMHRLASEADQPAELALTMNQSQVLQTMARIDASRLLSATMIAEEMDAGTRLSEETVRLCVRKLIAANLAERPEGERSGARLNIAGRKLAGKIAD